MPVVISTTVRKGTAVTVAFQFQKPTWATFPTVKLVAATPSTVTVTWRWASSATATTWTYGVGGQIAKITGKTGAYVCTIPTKTAPSDEITGTVKGVGTVTAVATWSVLVQSKQ